MDKGKIKEQINSHLDVVLPITYNILFVNDIVCGLVIDALALLKNNDNLYTREVKMYAKKVDRQREIYERKINRIIGCNCNVMFADYNDIFSDDVKKDLDVLYYSIKDVYDAHNIEYSELFSKLEMAHIILQYSCRMVDSRMEELKNTDSIFNSINLGYMRMTDTLKMFEKMLSMLSPKYHIDINTYRCQLAMKIIDKDFSDTEKIYKVITQNGDKKI